MNREKKILETVLSSTRIENDRLQTVFTKVDCIDVVKDTLAANSEDAKHKNLDLKTEISKESLFAWAGRDQAKEILDNLVSNAVKYKQKGSIVIKLEDANDFVEFSVTDTGEGIPADEIPNLGKKFHRINMYVPSTDKEHQTIRPGGTGIGLYVVFGLVKIMNGRIEVKSKIGEGSTFIVYLPKYTNQDNVK